MSVNNSITGGVMSGMVIMTGNLDEPLVISDGGPVRKPEGEPGVALTTAERDRLVRLLDEVAEQTGDLGERAEGWAARLRRR